MAEGPLPRARGSVGGLAGGSSFYNGSFNGNVDVVGFYLRAGIQWSHGFGTELEGAAASAVLTSSVHAGMFVDRFQSIVEIIFATYCEQDPFPREVEQSALQSLVRRARIFRADLDARHAVFPDNAAPKRVIKIDD